tara:strand:+ start:1617 stop:2534 length:918 start_codon:yes stop_codon:yes gene_type:complete
VSKDYKQIKVQSDFVKASKPLWLEKKPEGEFVNEDTYQTLKDFRVDSVTPVDKNQKPYSIFVGTPCHSEVSLHYVQALLKFSQMCYAQKVHFEVQIMKSSLVTQGRNLCVSGFLASKCSHLLFIDSDIHFNPATIFKMIVANKDVISVPYPLKTFMWDKAFDEIKNGNIKSPEQLSQSMNSYPMRVPDEKDIQINNGVIEVTHSPTGCMLINREVFNKMIKAYPNREISQHTIINGKLVPKKHMWNFFDTLHDPVEKTYLGEDFAFCKLWKDIGGTCYAYVNDEITHVGEHTYSGKFVDELKINE